MMVLINMNLDFLIEFLKKYLQKINNNQQINFNNLMLINNLWIIYK